MVYNPVNDELLISAIDGIKVVFGVLIVLLCLIKKNSFSKIWRLFKNESKKWEYPLKQMANYDFVLK